jgi:hypothetical protein
MKYVLEVINFLFVQLMHNEIALNVKIHIRIFNKCSYMFRFNQTIIREPTVCASLKLQYCRQLKYFVIELFGRARGIVWMWNLVADIEGGTRAEGVWE